MGTSYQDIDTRLKVIEDKVEFMLTVSQVTLQLNSPLAAAPQVVKLTMKEFYQEMQRQGGMIIGKPEDAVKGLVGDNTTEPGVRENRLPIEFTEGEVVDADYTIKRIEESDATSVPDQGSNEDNSSVVSAE
jgi:hypothetical protein